MNFEILLGFWEDLRDENKVLVRSRRISASETCSRGFWTVNNGKWVNLSTISKSITNMIYSRGVREIRLPCWCNFSTLLITDKKSSNSSLSALFFPAPYTKIFKLPKSIIRTNSLSDVEDSKHEYAYLLLNPWKQGSATSDYENPSLFGYIRQIWHQLLPQVNYMQYLVLLLSSYSELLSWLSYSWQLI